MGEYHDVLLIADVFEEFRNIWIEYDGLDTYHYFSSPGLSLDAMLKIADVI